MFKKLKTTSWTNWLMITALVICNIILIKQNMQLREIVKQDESEKKVQVGQMFNEFKAVDGDNNPISLASDKPIKKVILFSSTSCPFCKKQNPFWTQLADQISKENYEIFMLFNNREEYSKVKEYLKNNGYENIHNLVTPLYSNGEMLQKYRLNGTPTTVVIDESGVVEKTWSGLWDKMTVAEVEDYFNIFIN